MKTCIVAFNGVNLLNFAQIYDFLRQQDAQFDVVSFGECKDEFGFHLPIAKVAQPLCDYENIVVPHGPGALDLQYDDIFLSWIKGAKNAKFKLGLGLGTIILRAAKILPDAVNSSFETCGAFCAQGVEFSALDPNKALEKLAAWIKKTR